MGKRKRGKRKKRKGKPGEEKELVLHPREMGMPSQKILKLMLEAFWDHFGGKKCWGGGHPREEKLRLLRDYSQIRIVFREDRTERAQRQRKKFQRVKVRRHNLKTLKRCFVCLGTAVERHHIISLRNGGDNRKRNIVSLCEGCHNDIHPWMKGKPRQWKKKLKEDSAPEITIPWGEREATREFVLLALSSQP